MTKNVKQKQTNMKQIKSWVCRSIIPIITFLLIGSGFIYPQTATDKNSRLQVAESIQMPLSYSKDAKGFWVKRPPKTIENLPDTVSVTLIGKNNKTQSVYGLTNTSIIQFNFSKDNYAEYKKDKLLSNIKDKEWEKIFSDNAERLNNIFGQLNENRAKEIEDSIAEVQRLERLRAEEEARREAIRQDSILKARKVAEMQKEDEEYRKTHPKYILDLSDLKEQLGNLSNQVLGCVIDGCEKDVTDDIIYPIDMYNDTLIYLDYKDGPLGIRMADAHALKLGVEVKCNSEINRYLRAWGDSLTCTEGYASRKVELYNFIDARNTITELKKKAPNGYIEDWSWNYRYGPATLYVRYCNTNSKTIKYIKFFFTIYNDVNDVRGRGSVQGTGPLEEFESASWDFDRTGCWPAGDASTMRITKIVITYMNGSVATLTGNKILYE